MELQWPDGNGSVYCQMCWERVCDEEWVECLISICDEPVEEITIDVSVLKMAIDYISSKEVEMDHMDGGLYRSLEAIIKDGDMPDIYFDLLGVVEGRVV